MAGTLVCFSGGCDSTLALYDLATNSSSIWPIRTLSINHPQVEASKAQARARRKILAELRLRRYHVRHTEVDINHVGPFGIEEGSESIQPGLWISTAVTYLNKDEDLVMGYVQRDSNIWHHRHELVEAFKMLQKVSGKTGNITFPLEFTDKPEIITRLRKAKLLDLAWWCQRADKRGRQCGKCPPCIRHKTALYQLSITPLVAV